ncbi:hypothetical protein V8F33_012790 [Rhypophila sp. PSN 637]
MRSRDSENSKDLEQPSTLAELVSGSAPSPTVTRESPNVAPGPPSHPSYHEDQLRQQMNQISRSNHSLYGRPSVQGPTQPARPTLPHGPYAGLWNHLPRSSPLETGTSSSISAANQSTFSGNQAQVPSPQPRNNVGDQRASTTCENQNTLQGPNPMRNSLGYNGQLPSSNATQLAPSSLPSAAETQGIVQPNAQIRSQNQWQLDSQGASAAASQRSARLTTRPSGPSGPNTTNQTPVGANTGYETPASSGPSGSNTGGPCPSNFTSGASGTSNFTSGGPGPGGSSTRAPQADDNNCAFWITHLDPNVAINDITSAIRDCGKIWSLRINTERTVDMGDAAAKLVFFTRRGATRFWERHGIRRGAFVVRGQTARVHWNRRRVAEQSRPPYHTRCIRVMGAPQVVNPCQILRFLESRIRFQVDQVIGSGDGHLCVVEIRFAAYYGQASLAIRALQNQGQFARDPTFEVIYRPDPCDEVNDD